MAISIGNRDSVDEVGTTVSSERVTIGVMVPAGCVVGEFVGVDSSYTVRFGTATGG